MIGAILKAVGDVFRAPENRRSWKWEPFRKAHLLRNPHCVDCGTTVDCEVHHVIPFQVDPSKELDPTNVRTACRRDHLYVGHPGGWNYYNVFFDLDAALWASRIGGRKKIERATNV